MKAYECSTRGDKRFSALVARVKSLNNQTIEWMYQVVIKGYDSIAEGKGKIGLLHNFKKQKELYERCWFLYLEENPKLLEELLVITETHILTDMFATPNSVNQADTLMSIANKTKNGGNKMARKKMSEVKEPKGGYLTLAGSFEMEIIEVKEATASSGNTTNKIKLECEDGILFDNVTMIEKSMGFVKRYLSAAGYDIDDLEYDVNKKDRVTKLFLEGEEWSLEELLTDEPTTVLVTTTEGEKSYRNPTTGETVIVDEPMAKIKSIEFIEEDDE